MDQETPFLPGSARAVIVQTSQLWTRSEDIQKQTRGWFARLVSQLEAPAEVRPKRKIRHAASKEI